MHRLKKMFNRLSSNNKAKSTIDIANDLYKEKPFVLAYQSLYSSVCSWAWLVSSVSVISTSFIFLSLFSALPIWARLSIGLLLSTGYEALKDLITREGFRDYFLNGFGVALGCSVLMYVGSVAFSTFGTVQAYQMLLNSNRSQIEAKHAVFSDSAATSFDSAIKRARTEAELFKEANLVVVSNGKKALRYDATKTYNRLVERVMSLESQKQASISKIDNEEEAEVELSAAGSVPYLYLLIGISLGVEILIFGLRRFREYYLFRTYQEGVLMDDDEIVQVPVSSLSEILLLYQQNRLSVLPANQGKIGFKSGRSLNGSQKEQASGQGVQSADSPISANCVRCGSSFVKRTTWHKYCSKKCNHESNGFEL